MRTRRWLAAAGVTVACALAVPTIMGAARGTTTPLMGFDTATAPTAKQMQTWMADSSYRAIGVYIPVAPGTDDRHDKVQANLTKGWVRQRRAEGWSIIPIYLGVQAPAGCGNDAFWQMSVDPGRAYQQGRSAADSAADAVVALGIAHAPVYYDMEAYSPGCSSAVRAFFQGWTTGLHAAGDLAGVYGSRASTMSDVAGMLASSGCVRPDAVWPATDNGRSSVFGISPLSDTAWAADQRINQSRLGHSETHGGVRLSIDTDVVDGPVVGPTSIPTPAPVAATTPTASAAPSTGASTAPTTPVPVGSCVPGPPVAVSATSADGSVTLTWTRPANGGAALTGYTVTDVTTGRSYHVGPGKNHRVITGLTDGRAYEFTVTAANAVGVSFPSWRVEAAPVGKPAQMARPSVSVPRSHRLTVRWTAPASRGASITAYTVFLDGKGHRVAASKRTITFTGLGAATYQVRVAATNRYGRGPSSTVVRVAVP